MSALEALVKKIVKYGDITLIDYQGRETLIEGSEPGRSVVLRMHDHALPGKIAAQPDLAIGEGYMDGTLDFGDGDLWGFLQFYGQNAANIEQTTRKLWSSRKGKMFRFLSQANPIKRSRKNVAHHYDLSSDLYELFLDKERNYSCGYFAKPSYTLEQAQAAKKRRIAAKMALKDGQTVLDIGSGWGGMAFYLASMYDVEVLGITLSEEQHKLATQRADQLGLSDRVRFEIKDFRDVTQSFDRIVSIGMFEHVGAPNYDGYFQKVNELLTDDGLALIHTIIKRTIPAGSPAWIHKYIFPGGYIPSISEVFSATEKSGLTACDLEIWRNHYAETLKQWWLRFSANQDKAADLYDQRFCRMWEFYLRSCEAEFRYGSLAVGQFQLTKGNKTVPRTRAYIQQLEARLPLMNKF